MVFETLIRENDQGIISDSHSLFLDSGQFQPTMASASTGV
jgi:hypothetical protein